MNHITDDNGKTVIAVGAPGSPVRAACQWPHLIERLDLLYLECCEARSPGRGVDQAIDMIRQAGITDPADTRSILSASLYGHEPPGSVTDLVMRV